MGLIEFLKKNENSRKIFGKKELIIIEKQLLGMNLTQSEKNRLSRDIRKKIEFMKELTSHNFNLSLKKGTEIKERINAVKEHILESEYSSKIKRIVLFGSVAERKHLFRSDLDIAVEFMGLDKKEASKFLIRFNYNEKIQVSVYNNLPEKLKEEIDKNGKVIYERKNK